MIQEGLAASGTIGRKRVFGVLIFTSSLGIAIRGRKIRALAVPFRE
jgi:hypothetical protein